MKQTYQLRIQDPSGSVRCFSLRYPDQFPAILGKGTGVTHELKDLTLSEPCIEIKINSSTDRHLFRMRALSSLTPVSVGDLTAIECDLPLYTSLQVGDTQISILPFQGSLELPEMPRGLKAWESVTESGKKTAWLAKKAASTPLSIYLQGETGTGKEVLAHLIHAWSPRASGPFVALNCGALPFNLAESELFGHIKGAFTGANQARPGAFRNAHQGTLFLDEIGDLPLDIQVKLLRFLENGEVRPVGADQSSRVDVRVICATHHSLKQLVEEGKFRRDLYFRIASVTVEIAPLRDRQKDIECLAIRFANDLGYSLSGGALKYLKAYSWPGNVRELRHAVERACALAGPFDKVIKETQFDFLISSDQVDSSLEMLAGPILKMHDVERVLIIKALKIHNGNRTQAAKSLGVSRSTLFEMIKRHELRWNPPS